MFSDSQTHTSNSSPSLDNLQVLQYHDRPDNHPIYDLLYARLVRAALNRVDDMLRRLDLLQGHEEPVRRRRAAAAGGAGGGGGGGGAAEGGAGGEASNPLREHFERSQQGSGRGL